jgi:MYXO-CTERM domain-containing protein
MVATATAGPTWAAPQVVKGPYLTGLSDSRVEVRFELDAPAAASVELVAEGGESPARTIEDPAGTMHVVRTAGLQPAKSYGYTVKVGGAVAGKGRFTTAPSPTSSTQATFLVYGDDRSDETTHAAIVRVLGGIPADFLVNTGDIVNDGGRAADWASFFRVETPLLKDRALFLSIGNHELYDDEAGANFARYFGFTDDRGALAPYGTMRWGAVRLFFLNGMHDWQKGDERQWLEQELTKADGEAGLVWRVVVVHHGPWSSGPHGGNAKLISARIPELLSAHHVDLILSGHDHIYERGQTGQLKYVISGGGGAPLYPIQQRTTSTRKAESVYHFVEVTASAEAMRIIAHTIDGTVLEACGFRKGALWDCDEPAPQAGPAGKPPEAAPSPDASSSKCGCRVPGGAPSTGAPALVALAALSILARRRRRG